MASRLIKGLDIRSAGNAFGEAISTPEFEHTATESQALYPTQIVVAMHSAPIVRNENPVKGAATKHLGAFGTIFPETKKLKPEDIEEALSED